MVFTCYIFPYKCFYKIINIHVNCICIQSTSFPYLKQLVLAGLFHLYKTFLWPFNSIEKWSWFLCSKNVILIKIAIYFEHRRIHKKIKGVGCRSGIRIQDLYFSGSNKKKTVSRAIWISVQVSSKLSESDYKYRALGDFKSLCVSRT